MAMRTGLKHVFAARRCRRNGPIGRNSLICLRLKTLTTARTAVTKTDRNRGPAAIVIAHANWRKSWLEPESRFWPACEPTLAMKVPDKYWTFMRWTIERTARVLV